MHIGKLKGSVKSLLSPIYITDFTQPLIYATHCEFLRPLVLEKRYLFRSGTDKVALFTVALLIIASRPRRSSLGFPCASPNRTKKSLKDTTHIYKTDGPKVHH